MYYWSSIQNKTPHTFVRSINNTCRNYFYSMHCMYCMWLVRSLTLSLLGYFETRICWGGGQVDPHPLNPMFDVQIWQMIHHWKALVLYFQNLQKNLQICKNWIFFAKSSYIVKMCAKKNLSKKWKIIHFWKALDHAISNMQKILQNFK